MSIVPRPSLTLSYRSAFLRFIRKRGRLVAFLFLTALASTPALSAYTPTVRRLCFDRVPAAKTSGLFRSQPNQNSVALPKVSAHSDANALTERSGHSAMLLSDGRVLIAGGRDDSEELSSTEIFDPNCGAFSSGSDLVTVRASRRLNKTYPKRLPNYRIG